jgi:serine/threonine protein kinase/tetratricopeptide (TPR) repeat protein
MALPRHLITLIPAPPMEPSRWEKLREIFGEAIERPAASREEFITTMCADDPEMLHEVRSLLSSNTQAGTFLESLAIPAAPLVPRTGSDDARIGTFIGPYRIVRAVGHGGMGSVYEAMRDDGLFSMRVAIKLLHSGMSTEATLRRFHAERQVLASLQHSNIARLIDGGTTEDGLPYFVMEFVEGVRIDEYCDAHRLSIDQRLQMFRTLCAAVQYAHQHLVVHRDIKPGNILVTADGTPKLLDFGIAKLLTEDSTPDHPEMTQTGLNIFTPEYASPEQIRGEEVTTASDVYSLGMLLYKLLTGRKPYEFKSSFPHEIARTVLDTEPVRAGSRPSLITTPDGGAKLRKMLHGDLDNIILMALRKEPARRYSSVEQFSDDIGHYLHGLPATATRGSSWYRLGKFTRRNRVAVISGALIVLSLMGGLAVTLYENRVVRNQEVRAEKINSLLMKILGFSNPLSRTPGQKEGEATMTDALDEAVRHIDSGELADQPEFRAELEQIISEGYGSHGRYDLYELHQLRCVAIQESLYGSTDTRTLGAKATRAIIMMLNGKMAEPERLFRETLPRIRSAVHDGTIAPGVFVNALVNFGYLRREQGDSHEAEMLFREALSLAPSLPAENRYMIRLTRSTLASTLADQGRFDEAFESAQQATVESRETGAATLPDYGFVLTVYGGFLAEKRRFASADSVLAEGVRILRQTQLPSSLWIGDNLRNQATSFYMQGQNEEAIARAREAISIYDSSFGITYDNYPTALTILGLALNKTGKHKEAEQFLRQAVAIREKYMPAGHFWRALTNSALGEFLTSRHRYAEAEPLLLESFESLKKSQGDTNPRTILARERLVSFYRTAIKPALAHKYE